ncbi:RagB/SusD family nutrient uptake outer membrane protein [Flavobacterium sp. 5]|uniref:RagB/SusD family nutrient uptake outer membrane protein n=1 Tax=Flavobacterium sp. 5 TaxID=2035199 RepID=UPI000CAEB9DF|nr:RagB/SusD family nutrient uptake outer membrane protein [Flavobacterium sp. 5]PKB18146.1 putative outer membrane starch-binding protein [Flavobacterium sp. 5]
MKSIKYKNIKYFLIVLLVLPLLNSCDDAEFLDRRPLGTAADGDIKAGGFEEKAFGLYGQIRTSDGVTDWCRYFFESVRSDDAITGSNASDTQNFDPYFEKYQYTTTHFMNTNNWNGHYKVIYACNDLIDAVDTAGVSDEGSLINKAEAMVIRAFLYFDLRRDYGEVPIVTNKIVKPSDGIKPKSTVAEVDVQIINDLTFAAEHLPLSWPAYPGRATKGFANTLLAKLYLYQGNWAKSLEKSQEVIDSGQYSLYTSYADLFKEGGDNSPEAVFEIQFLRQGGINYSNNYWESQGVRGSGSWDLGFGLNVPNDNLIGAYETNDPRRLATILYSGQDDGTGLILPTKPPLDQAYWNKKAYTTLSVRQNFGENKNHWINIKILRYADVLLMAAEAANELGNTAAAGDYLEMVRARARGNNPGVLPPVSGSQSILRTAIKHERRIEFAMEGERFYDLVRWGDAVNTLGGLGYQDKNKWYPIPQTAIDQFGGVLVQNPNY